MTTTPDIQIIVPCYNPQPNWSRRFYNGFINFQRQFPDLNVGVTLVNDGTTNGLVKEELSFISERIPELVYEGYEQNQGKGYAVRHGVKNSKANITILTDIDFPYRTSSMMKVIDSLNQSNDVVTGYRDHVYYSHTPFHRKIVSKTLRWLLQHALRLPINDSQCGLKGFNQKGRELFLTTSIDRFLYDMEFLVISVRKKDIKLEPVLVYLRDDVEFTAMNPKILLQELINFVRILFKSIF